jgi:hypothetical protein
MSLGQLRIHLVRDSRDIEQQQAEIQRVQIASPHLTLKRKLDWLL